MITAESFITIYTRTARNVHTHLEGLTHVDALVQPPVEGNCILWIMGHIICYRNYMLDALYYPPILPLEQAKRFARESAPVLADEPGLTTLETMVTAYDQAQEFIFEGLRRLTAEQAAEVITQRDFTMPRDELIMVYMRHEAYHTGQFELLRQIALAARK